jgi:hypothetical protein
MTKKRCKGFLLRKRWLLGVALFVWASSSHAWLTTYHIGFLYGSGNQEVSKNDLTTELNNNAWSTDQLDFDESSRVKKLYGGFYFTPNFGVQLEYIDLGSVDITGTGKASGEEQAFADALVEAMPSFGVGAAVSVIGRFPIWGRFVIQDWVGIFGWKNEIEVALPNGRFKGNDDGIDLALGVSLEYLVTDSLSARIEWERFNQDGDGINILGGGLTYYFGK